MEKAIELGLSSKQRECRKLGHTFDEIVDETAEDNAVAEAAGVTFAAPDLQPDPETVDEDATE